MAVSRHQQVLWLQVPVGDLLLVQILQRKHDFRDIEQCHVVRKHVLSSQEPENFSSLHVLECEVHVGVVFETLVPKDRIEIVSRCLDKGLLLMV